MVGFNFFIYCECANKDVLCVKPSKEAAEVMQNASCGDCFSSIAVRKASRNDRLCNGPPFTGCVTGSIILVN